VRADGGLEVWSKPLSGGAVAVGLFNRTTSAAPISVTMSELGLAGAGRIESMWPDSAYKKDGAGVSATVPAHGVVLLRIEP
jgi:alpha-galactosidase